jgi:hypothetical protein
LQDGIQFSLINDRKALVIFFANPALVWIFVLPQPGQRANTVIPASPSPRNSTARREWIKARYWRAIIRDVAGGPAICPVDKSKPDREGP